MLKSYAHHRFTHFCSEVEDFSHDLNSVLSQAEDALFHLENDQILDPSKTDDRILAREAEKIRRRTARELEKIIKRFSPNTDPVFLKKPARDRIIKRDVACRYLRRFGGSTEWIQTDIDAGYPVLIDKDGDKRGIVDSFDAFPKPVEIHENIPF